MTTSHNSRRFDAASQRRATAWAQAALESELRDLAGTSAHRNDALNKAAFDIGQLVGGGLIEHGTAQDRLVETALGIGLMTRDERKKTLSTIKRALAAGMKHARFGPEDSGDGRGRRRESRANGAAQQEGDETRELAKRRWVAAYPAGSDTPVGKYLRTRGIASPPNPSSVRYHSHVRMPDGSRHPELLAV